MNDLVFVQNTTTFRKLDCIGQLHWGSVQCWVAWVKGNALLTSEQREIRDFQRNIFGVDGASFWGVHIRCHGFSAERKKNMFGSILNCRLFILSLTLKANCKRAGQNEQYASEMERNPWGLWFCPFVVPVSDRKHCTWGCPQNGAPLLTVASWKYWIVRRTYPVTGLLHCAELAWTHWQGILVRYQLTLRIEWARHCLCHVYNSSNTSKVGWNELSLLEVTGSFWAAFEMYR